MHGLISLVNDNHVDNNLMDFFCVCVLNLDCKQSTQKTQRCKDQLCATSEIFFYHLSTVLSKSFGKTYFIWRFIPNEKK